MSEKGYVTAMAMTNAQKQARWRERNVVVLTESAKAIAEKLMGMDDQDKLRKITRLMTGKRAAGRTDTDDERRECLLERTLEAKRLALEDPLAGVPITNEIYDAANEAAKLWTALATKFRRERKKGSPAPSVT
jgi:hypothetical protein